jgi:conjugative relaxase-like TrwC/TraI family protein
VRSALKEFEAFAATRIRVGRASSDRLTGNFAAALFTHDTSRALDPHLHTHCIVFNATFDAVENRWKALQNYELLRARKFAENAYYHELARELRGFGYRIRNLPRGDFQVEGVPEELCQRFSKRDAEIDKALAGAGEIAGRSPGAWRREHRGAPREARHGEADAEAKRFEPG